MLSLIPPTKKILKPSSLWRKHTYVDMRDKEAMREMQMSIAASSSVFPGFRFSPTDEELISYYLKKKLQGCDDCVDIIPEVDFCLHEPWDLPAISIIRSENEWFFFSARGKKYPNGSQSRRATRSGYWKATGKERNVKAGALTIGTKRTLVFHMGRAPKGERTEWIMHEYCMTDATPESLVVCRLRRNGDFRLNLHSGNDNNNDNNNKNNTQITAVESCSKESTSDTSHSPIHNSESDSDSESGQNDSPHGSSKECEKEDDCFADIMNDDIIELDESASNCVSIHGVDMSMLVRDPTKCTHKETISFNSLSGQGTAVRRNKLSQQKAKKASSKEDQQPRCVISQLAKTRTRTRYLILVFFSLLIMFVAWPGWFKEGTQGLAS